MTEIRRVGGAQAEMARRDLGLIKIDKPSAKKLYNAGVNLVVVGNNVNSFHFFGGWHLAFEVDTKRYLAEGETFDAFVNNFMYYLDPELGSQAAFFVKKIDLV